MIASASKSVPEIRSRRRFAAIVVVVILLFAGTIASVVYLTSDSFRNYVRGRVVTQLEQITGGSVELGQLRWNLSRLRVQAENLTVHGLEGPGEVPYAHVDHMLLDLKIFSLLEQDLGIRYLQLDRPVLHLIVYPDGHTNQPVPPKARLTAKPDIQQLFRLELDRAVLHDGTLIINEQRIPLDGSARNVAMDMSYASRLGAYQGKVQLENIDVRYGSLLSTQVKAETQFSLLSDRLEVKSAKVSTAKSSISFSGQLTKFANPAVGGTFDAVLDLSEVGSLTRNPELRKGSAAASGSFQFSSATYSSAGKLSIRGLEYHHQQISARDVDVAADYNFTPERVGVRNLVAHVFSGTVRGEGVVDNWLAEPPVKGKAKTPKTLVAERAGSAQFRLENVSVARLVEAVLKPSLQLSRLNPVGAMDGAVEVRWKGTLNSAVVGLNATVTPPPSPASGTLPLTAELHGNYELAVERLTLSQFSVGTPNVRTNGSGSIGKRNEQLSLHVAIDDLSKLQGILRALNQPVAALDGVTGRGTFHGTVSGLYGSPDVSGRVELADISMPVAGLQRATPQATVGSAVNENVERIQFDSLKSDVEYSQRNLILRNGTARRQQANATFDFSALLTQGQLEPNSPISGHFSLQNEDIATLQRMIGYNYPIEGKVTATAQVTGTKDSPQGSGHVQVNDVFFYGEPAKSIAGDVSFSAQRISTTHLVIAQNGARATIAGFYDSAHSEFQLHAAGDNLELAKIQHLQNSKMRIAGKVTFTVDGSGTVSTPVINGTVQATKLALNDQSIGNLHLDAVTKGDMLQLTARSDFERAQVDLNGTVHLREDFPADLKANFAEFNIAPFIPNHTGTTTRMAGTVTATVPLRHPDLFTADLEVSQLSADVHKVRLSNAGPIRVNVNSKEVRIDSLKIQGDDTELTGSGTIALTGRKALKLSANGHVNLRLAQTLDPDLATSGSVNFNLDIAGSVTRPRMLGQLTIADGAIALIDLPNGLSNINGTLVFDQDQLSVQSMTARTGGGNVNVGGYIAYRDELSFNLTAAGKDIRLRYPQGVSSSADMDMRLSGSLKNSTLSGDITVTRFGITPQFDLALYLARSKMAPQAPNPDSPTYNLHLDMHVVSTPELQVQTTVGKLAGDVDLHLRGTAAKPVVLGRINITEGQIAFNGTNYELRRGDITFTNPVGIVPVLNVEAGTRIRNYDITLGFHGDVNHLATNYRSDPPLPEADVISLLAFGRTREETDLSASSGFAMNGTVSNALLGEALNSAVGDRVQKLFGVSRIKISPDYATTTTNPAAQVTIEQQVSKKITVTYITSLTQTTYSQQAISVEYNINRNVSVVGGRDLYGIVSFDVKIRQRKQ